MSKVPSFLSFFLSHDKQALSGSALAPPRCQSAPLGCHRPLRHGNRRYTINRCRLLCPKTHTNWALGEPSWGAPPSPTRKIPPLGCFIDPGNGDNGCYSHQQQDLTAEGEVFAPAGQQQQPRRTPVFAPLADNNFRYVRFDVARVLQARGLQRFPGRDPRLYIHSAEGTHS